jgi:amino acid permease
MSFSTTNFYPLQEDTTSRYGTSKKGASVYGAAFSYISTIIGAGIISLPYALQEAGTLVGVLLHAVIITLLLFSTLLYLKSKDNLKFE